MKQLILAVALAGSVSLVACKPANDPDKADMAKPAATPPASTADTPSSAMPSDPASMGANMKSGDAMALGLLAAVDENEIAAATQAQEKNVKGAVLDYAKTMEKEHSENLDKTKGMGELADNDDVKSVKDKGASEASTLDQKSGKDYEKAYIDAMVSGHKEALSMIDDKMMGAATSDAVKQHLTDTRKHVEQHLAKAEEIQKTM